MQADMAPNSDSTMRYSHGASSPVRTRSDSDSTMWVCGEIGYAAITSGRHRVTARATACEPSIWLSIGQPPIEEDVGVGRPAAPRSLAGAAGEPVPDRAQTAPSDTWPVSAANAPSRAALGSGRPRCSRAISVAGTVTTCPGSRRSTRSCSPSASSVREVLTSRQPCVESPANRLTWCSRVGSWTRSRVRVGDRLAEPDRPVVDPAEGDDRRAGALGAEGRERLGVPALVERRDRQQLGRGDGALAAATVDADGEHHYLPVTSWAVIGTSTWRDQRDERCSPTRCRTSRTPSRTVPKPG